ncbi:MAG: MMPL family transporter [Acidobacteria bacterium]|nr:MMPL family transporter [Acidobacteriota bacterium]
MYGKAAPETPEPSKAPTSPFTRLGRVVVAARRRVLVGSVIGMVIAVVLGVGVFDRLKTSGFEEDGAEAVRAVEELEDRFGTGDPSVVFLLSAPAGVSVDDPQAVTDGEAFTATLEARDDIDDVVSYWSLGRVASLRSVEGDRALVMARIPGNADDNPNWSAVLGDLQEYAGTSGIFDVEISGRAEIFERVGDTIKGDLAKAEAIAIPITALLLIGVFGGLIAALLPLAVGVMAIFGAFFVLFLVTGVTDVSIFSLNLVTAMSLGLAVDYSLFIVSRFREELAAGRGVDAAVIRTVETAGRTVAFSALTVAVSLAALLIFPLYFLRSFAYAGVGVLLIAMVASVVTLPALLATIGTRIDRFQFWSHNEPADGEGFWYGMATRVMRRPLLVAVSVITLLVLVGLPFLRVEWGTPDHRVLPDGDPAREAFEVLEEEFDSNEPIAFPVVVIDSTLGESNSAGDTPGVEAEAIDGYAAALSNIEGVDRVDAATGRYVDGSLIIGPDESLERHVGDGATWFNVVPSVQPISTEGEAIVQQIRGLDSNDAGVTDFEEVLVGGQSASLIDTKESILSRIPLAAAWIGFSTFVLLFLMFGSLLVPLKAIVLNLLSLTATFGIMVWVFQYGHGSGLMDFTATGLTDVTTPILMFCVAFGLSMDYEVFLLSRIKEEYDHSGDNDEAIALGLQRTGRIVTAAAALLAVTFFAIATSQVTFIKLFGLGLGVAVLVDATIVRATLVPALMKLAGEANWWLPGWLRRVHDRLGFAHDAPVEEPEQPELLEPIREDVSV